jgi:hypothetical protein
MTEDRNSTVSFALAGLFACVAVAWAVLFATGSFATEWLLAGALAFGLGVLAVNGLDRVGHGLFVKPALRDKAGTQPEPSAPVATDADTLKPRLSIMVASSLLEALALSLFAGYLLNSLVISIVAGLLLSALAIAISLRVSQRFSESEDATRVARRLERAQGRSSEGGRSNQGEPGR